MSCTKLKSIAGRLLISAECILCCPCAIMKYYETLSLCSYISTGLKHLHAVANRPVTHLCSLNTVGSNKAASGASTAACSADSSWLCQAMLPVCDGIIARGQVPEAMVIH